MALKLYNKAVHAVRYWLLRKLPTCQQTVSLLSESLERPLTLRERVKMKLHLWVCIWCTWYLEHLHVMRDTIRMRSAKEAIEDDCPPAPSLSAEARERLKRALSRTDQSL
jgi:hypothetical protein